MDPIDMLSRMCKELDCQAKEVEEAEDWYEGNHPIPLPAPNTLAAHDQEARRAFEVLQKLSITNFLPAVADTPTRKLRIEGIRFSDRAITEQAWAIWQRNFMDSDFDLAIASSMQVGNAYALVWADSDGQAEITIEDPRQTIVWYQAGSRRKRQAGMKRWTDDDGYTCATLYLSNWIYKYQSPLPADQMANAGNRAPQWIPRQVDGEPWPLPNPLGAVPVVEIRHKRCIEAEPFGGGDPEFEGQINDQRKINHTVFSMLTTMDNQAFRQKWATGWGIPTDADGNPDKVAIMKAAASSIWGFDDPDVKVGDFPQADFQPFITAIYTWVKAIASNSGTPPYAFLLGDMINVAADSLARIDGVLTTKVQAASRHLGENAGEILRLALLAEGSDGYLDTTSTVLWADIEQRTATEQANLAQIAKNLGVPEADFFAMLPDVDQQTAQRWAAEAVANRLMFPQPTPVP